MLGVKALAALLVLLVQTVVSSASSRVVTLHLPHRLRAGESVWLEVAVGPLPRGTEIQITAMDGKLVGTISPFGRPASESGATYTGPVPVDVVGGQQLSVRMILERDQLRRAPTGEEVRSVRLTVTDSKR